MYRAKAAYQPKQGNINGILPICAGEIVQLLSEGDGIWWYAQKVHSNEVGYVPAKYFEFYQQPMTVSNMPATSIENPDDVSASIDRALEAINQQIEQRGGQVTPGERVQINQLLKHKDEVMGRSSAAKENLVAAKSQPAHQHQQQQHKPTQQQQTPQQQQSKRRAPPPPPMRGQTPPPAIPQKTVITANVLSGSASTGNNDSRPESSPLGSTNKPTAESIIRQMIEEVRISTDLSHKQSQNVTKCVLMLARKYTDATKSEQHSESNALHQLIEAIEFLRVSAALPNNDLVSSHDACRLRELFGTISSWVSDTQERGWSLHDKQNDIVKILDAATSVLVNADSVLSTKLLLQDHMTYLRDTVTFFQLDGRPLVRYSLLRLLEAPCMLHRDFVLYLAQSPLILEIYTALQTRHGIPEACLRHYLLLTALLLTASVDHFPIGHKDALDQTFINTVLDIVECDQYEGGVPDDALNVLLAYNLHLPSTNGNKLTECLGERCSQLRSFPERIMLLINRGDDPLLKLASNAEQENECWISNPHSVLKLFTDIFYDPSAAFMLYSSDLKVLIDILIRQLTDLPQTNQRRKDYFELMVSLLKSNSLTEPYRANEIKRCCEIDDGSQYELICGILNKLEIK